jgi:hypothetical protein
MSSTSFGLRFESLLNGIFFKLRQSLRLSRRGYHEKACRILAVSDVSLARKIQTLKKTYAANFEEFFNLENTLENYHLLDVLDQAKRKLLFAPSKNQSVTDVGCKNFYYVGALQSFFQPRQLHGVEVDAYKLYQDLHTRLSYAESYLTHFPAAHFHPSDFLKFSCPSDGITLFYPFVVEYPLIKWTLPLKLFQPKKIFEHAFSLLHANGWLLMMNQGADERDVAFSLAEKAGFQNQGNFAATDTVLARDIAPIVSVWKKKV